MSTSSRDTQQITPFVTRKRLTARRLIITLSVLLILIVVMIVAATAIGSEHVDLGAIFKIITGRAAEVTPEERVIFADIRLPGC